MERQIVTIKGPVEAQVEEKKSVFIAHLAPVQTQEAAQEFVKQISVAHRDARHNCYCWRLSDGSERSSDNGEPSGTAGVPMLQVLQKSGLQDVCLVVTRYFGGILLGAPGLVRMYTKAATLAVEAARQVTYHPCQRLLVQCPYPLYDRVNYLLPDFALVTESSEFSDKITLTLCCRQTDLERLQQALAQVGNGRIICKLLNTQMAPI